MLSPDPARYLLTATVCDVEPPIWRAIDVDAKLSLGDLHVLLQLTFGWQDQHLHLFTDTDPYAPGPPGRRWGPPLPWAEEDEALPEFDWPLHRVLPSLDGALFYQYDFGDSWLVTVTPEPSSSTSTNPATVVDGARRGPLEDSGGVPGYLDLIEALADPQHPDHDELREWYEDMTGDDGKFDPEEFDAAAINAQIERAAS